MITNARTCHERDIKLSSLCACAMQSQRLHRAIGIMHGPVAHQGATVRPAVVRDGHAAVRSYDFQVKIDQPLARDVPAARSHAVRAVARRAGEAGVDVARVLAPTRILDDVVRQIMALAAHRIGAIDAEIRRRVEIRNPLPGTRRLAEFIAALQEMVPLGSMRPVRTHAAEFAIVVAVVAVGAVNLRTHGPARRAPVQLHHIGQQAGLWQATASWVEHRVA